MLSWSLFVRMHTRRNDWGCWSIASTSEFVPSVLLSFALPVENVWLIKIFQFLFVFFARLFFLVAQLTKMHSFLRFGIHLSLLRECVIALFQINTFHAIYLLTWDGVFRQTNSWYVVIYRVLSARMSLFCDCFRRWGNHFWTFICIKSGQAALIHDEISYSKLNQSSFLCVKRFLRCQLVVSFEIFL